MEKYNRLSEILWLILGIMCSVMVAYIMISEGSFKKSSGYIFIPLLAWAMYFMRRSLRIRFEKQKQIIEEHQGKKSKHK
jgi:hypothetical protein